MIPKLTLSEVRSALTRFDTTLRGTEEWQGWEQNKAHKYAIEDAGQHYPVKQVVSLASGVPVSDFSGGVGGGDANEAVERLGFTVVGLHPRNPDWTRDELILALDLYLRHRSAPPAKNSKDVLELSVLLNKLAATLHGAADKEQTFRNPNGVYMKLMNFRRLDPVYTSTGKKGLTRGGAADEVIWQEFATDPERCHKVAGAIMRILAAEPALMSLGDDDDDDELLDEAPEGRLLTRQHVRRERSRKLVESKKKAVLKAGGTLVCEVCQFDFRANYGDRGDGYIECHHTRPLETLEPGQKTHIRDLALVCSNCHRMIHCRRPWLTIDEMRMLLSQRIG